MNKNKSGSALGAPLGRITCLATLVMLVLAVFIFTSSAVIESSVRTANFSLSDNLSGRFDNMASEAVGSVYDLPKIYTLPLDNSPACVPNPENFYEVTEGGITYSIYEDETITVKLWKDKRDGANVNFADVQISNATQFRSAFAGGEYNMNLRSTAEVMAVESNAVLAVNADFYNYRYDGLIIRNGITYRDAPIDWDILLVDSKGDFHVGTYDEIKSSGVLEECTIYNSFCFGPTLVTDGKVNITNNKPLPSKGNRVARSAIGQLGELHYLICTVDGREGMEEGMYIEQVAHVMADMGCITAYNLDGGQSTTLVFNNDLYNVVAYGGQRLVGDILYFGTSLPEN
ncbi:MAG: phosphodiester glycosidase family protein [Clostridia bacterium]|nr:phosphodiester glycosidase family protein [Clostridia bacterium]MBQ9994467.1 phosphodiester glycosidase family protein [Clostridia bacterium]